eukprot:626117-Amorphochlora_amoeboformis.AAC.1
MGFTFVIVNGTWFGTSGEVSVDYGDPDDPPSWVTLSCPLINSYQLNCTLPGGAGGPHQWRVTVSGATSQWSNATTVFNPPQVQSVTIPSRLSTLGSESMIITGSSFGPTSTTVNLTYGQFQAIGCSVTLADTQIICTSVPGTGENLIATVHVGRPAQTNNGNFVSYFGPEINGLSVSSIGSDSATSVIISGSYFGPSWLPPVIMLNHSTYGNCEFATQSHNDGVSGIATIQVVL